MNAEVKQERDLQPHWARARRLAKHAWKHFKQDRSLEEAASLSYTSLLAIVPLLAVIFGIVAAFPVFRQWSDKLKSFIFTNFLPATGEQIESHINNFLASVSSLTLPGTVVLIVTALLLMFRIEVAFNRIWRVDQPRSLMNRIVVYWAVLTLAPILIAAAIALSAQNISQAFGAGQGLGPFWHGLGIFALTWLLITMMFLLIPNRRVRVRSALAGAFLSAVLFEIAKQGFVAWVSNANYTVIYGALATVPIFLVWVYLVWSVILLGASLTASLTTFSDYHRLEGRWPERWEFLLVYRLLGHLWTAQRKGEALEDYELLELERHVSERQLMRLMSGLRKSQLVAVDGSGAWRLARDIDELSLGDLYRLGDYYLPLPDVEKLPAKTRWDREFVAAMKRIADCSMEDLNRSLRSMYLEKKELNS